MFEQVVFGKVKCIFVKLKVSLYCFFLFLVIWAWHKMFSTKADNVR